MREKRLAKNTVSSLMFQITTIICGLILPRLVLKGYGSEVNGLVNSISQFLGIISFLELGVGAVVQSALYKPLASSDNSEVSKILASAVGFFKTLARILLVYVIILIIGYPNLVNRNFNFVYTSTLIGAISISSFAQYYFGVVDRLLLTADQKGYIQFNAQTITLLLNTVVCVVLIRLGSSIQLLKLITSLIYLLRPIFLRWYINSHYDIDRKINYWEEPIKQKWNGVAQHVAAIVLDGTDNIVLTLFSTLSDVSIYSVYFLVVNGVKQLFLSLTNGVQALIGEFWAKQELDKLRNFFDWVEWVIHTAVTLIFGCTMFLIVPFVSIYTRGINDTNYIQPLFAVLITSANALHCLRLPYNILILAAGHYKQTQHNYVIAAIINIIISILMVKKFGLLGVAIGTICAMSYQTFWMAIYDSRNLINWPISNFIKHLFVDILSLGMSYLLVKNFELKELNFIAGGILALKIFIVLCVAIIFINLVFYRSKIIVLIKYLKNRIFG